MEELKKFLFEAKKNAYANENAKETKVKGGGKLLIYSKENLVYQDKYFGLDPFSGEELIIKNGKVIWMMNYYGRTISKVSSKEVYTFLKRSLMKADIKNPFRGPNEFSEKDFKYLNKTEGTIDSFRGTEKILHKKKEVYYCNYHGGFVK